MSAKQNKTNAVTIWTTASVEATAATIEKLAKEAATKADAAKGAKRKLAALRLRAAVTFPEATATKTGAKWGIGAATMAALAKVDLTELPTDEAGWLAVADKVAAIRREERRATDYSQLETELGIIIGADKVEAVAALLAAHKAELAALVKARGQ